MKPDSGNVINSVFNCYDGCRGENSSNQPIIRFVLAALKLTVLSKCSTTKARACTLELPHAVVETPVFMPVGTQGTLKGLLPEQLEDLDCRIMLGNTYHLGNRPGMETMKKAGGLHKFMGWKRALLTDSGGFQMVSLLKLTKITEEGVNFTSPYDGSECMLTPEHSIEIQVRAAIDWLAEQVEP